METRSKAAVEQATSVATPVESLAFDEAHAAPSSGTTNEKRLAAAPGSASALDMSTLRGSASEIDQGERSERFDDLTFGTATADVAPPTTTDRVDRHAEIPVEDEETAELPASRDNGSTDEGDALESPHGMHAQDPSAAAVEARERADDDDATDEVDLALSADAGFVVDDSAYAFDDGELVQAVAEPDAAEGVAAADLSTLDESPDDRMLDDELAGFQLQPEELAAVPAPIKGIDALAAEVRNAEPIEAQAATSPGALAQGEAELQDLLARSQSRLHVLATLDMVARRVRGGEIEPSVDAGASPEAVLASVLAAMLSP